MKLLPSDLSRWWRLLFIATAIATVAVGSTVADAQKESKATPLLWRDPGRVTDKDLFWGIGSPDRVPQPPFTFLKEDTGGTKPKIHVRDAQGTMWNVKFDADSSVGKEVPSEIAASRIMWALGYLVEESYLVDEGVVDGIKGLERAATVISPAGAFRLGRFERRLPNVERLSKPWTMAANPFIGSKELSGLLVAVAMLNNWDFRRGNTEVLRVSHEGTVEDWYIISDLGSAFGRMNGGLLHKHTRWNVEQYRDDDHFILRADARAVELYYRPDGSERARVPLEHARWIAGLASQLTEAQLQRAFVAAGASPAEVTGFCETLMGRIRELQSAVAGAN